MNLLRMRKQVARATPDAVSRTFTMADDDVNFSFENWKDWFRRQMNIKHGSRCKSVDVWINDRDRLAQKPDEIKYYMKINFY